MYQLHYTVMFDFLKYPASWNWETLHRVLAYNTITKRKMQDSLFGDNFYSYICKFLS